MTFNNKHFVQLNADNTPISLLILLQKGTEIYTAPHRDKLTSEAQDHTVLHVP